MMYDMCASLGCLREYCDEPRFAPGIQVPVREDQRLRAVWGLEV
jgi:hypothetical protein